MTGVVDGQTSSEQSELVQLRRKARRLEMENEILRRAAAYFAASSLPKRATRWSVTWPQPDLSATRTEALKPGSRPKTPAVKKT